MAIKFTKNIKNNKPIVPDERIIDDPKGKGLVKKSGKVDNLLINRRGLINGPPVHKQDPMIKIVKSKGEKVKKPLSLLGK